MNLQNALYETLIWIQNLGTVSAVVFIGLYILATVLFIPGSILTLGAGVVFGVALGTIYVFIGATIGATLAFLIGRYLARGWVAKRIASHDKFSAIDAAIAREGLKIVLLTRLSPVFPFVLLNYALGITQVSLRDYVLGCVGMIPGTMMYVYIGSLAGSLATIQNSGQSPEAQRVQWVIRIVGLIATVAVTLYITRIARSALQKSVNSR
ncbi:TVP38/TMEM64 family protein [Phormidesmis sp. 146-12]